MKEAQHTEWKESWREDYLRWVCGFANAEGGSLHIGRNDRGVVVGVADAKKLLVDLPNQVRDILGILVDVNLRREAGLEFIEIRVDPYPHPISYRGHYYRRSGSTLQELKGPALDRFLLRRQGRTWDGVPVPGVKVADLSEAAIRRFRDLARTSGRLDPADLRAAKAALIQKLQLTDGRYLKRAAVLLFHDDPEKFVTGAFVKIGYFRSESDLAYHDTLHGDLFAQAARTIDLVRTKYLKAAITYQGIQRIERYPVPDAALREAVLNALVHRDYAVGASVQIRVYEDRLTLWNPCVLPDGWTVKNLLGSHPSTPFNPAIANVFFRAGEIETWGRGIQRIIAACKEAGTPRPRLRLEPNGLWLEFPFAAEYLKSVPTPQVTPQVTPQDKVLADEALQGVADALAISTAQITAQVTTQVSTLLNAASIAQSRGELQRMVALEDREHFRKAYLNPLLQAGWLVPTIPEKPNSRLQKYRLTTKGRAWLERLTKP